MSQRLNDDRNDGRVGKVGSQGSDGDGSDAGEPGATDGPRGADPRFAAEVLPHLDAAYNLARWLTRDDGHADDVMQTACLRAWRFFGGFHGGNARGWLLAIVRNSFYTWLDQHREHQQATPFDEEIHTLEPPTDPETQLLRTADAALLRRAFAALPLALREVIVLRELEGASYKEIASIVGIPIGTVMSRLARARQHLQSYLIEHGVGVGGVGGGRS
jgi:RNA polymerase sigma-70 factor (ECF subfamily)